MPIDAKVLSVDEIRQIKLDQAKNAEMQIVQFETLHKFVDEPKKLEQEVVNLIAVRDAALKAIDELPEPTLDTADPQTQFAIIGVSLAEHKPEDFETREAWINALESRWFESQLAVGNIIDGVPDATQWDEPKKESLFSRVFGS